MIQFCVCNLLESHALCLPVHVVFTGCSMCADKENKAVAEKLAWAESQRAKGLPTIPSTLGVSSPYTPPLHRFPSS